PRSHRPPTASPHSPPPAPPPPPLPPAHAAPAPLLSPLTRSEIPASLLDHPPAPGTLSFHRSGTSPRLPSDTTAFPSPQTAPPQTATPLTPPGSDTLVPAYPHQRQSFP